MDRTQSWTGCERCWALAGLLLAMDLNNYTSLLVFSTLFHGKIHAVPTVSSELCEAPVPSIFQETPTDLVRIKSLEFV